MNVQFIFVKDYSFTRHHSESENPIEGQLLNGDSMNRHPTTVWFKK